VSFTPNVGRLKSSVDAVLAKGVVTGAVPGVVAVVTTRDGTIYEGAFGVRDLGTAIPMTLDTIFDVASLTKAVTSTGLMQLVERGLVNLDAPAGNYVPYLGEIEVLDGFGTDGRPILRAPKTPLTTRHLLTHTGGFGYDHWNGEHRRYRQLNGMQSATMHGLRVPLVHDPGTQWEYGINTDWAAQLVKAVSGQDIDAFTADNLFAPLGIEGAWRISDAMRPRRASIHQRQRDGSLVPKPLEDPDLTEFVPGGHGIHIAGPEYAKFVRMFLNRGVGNGNRVLKDETVEQMSRPDVSPNNEVTMLRTFAPAISNDGMFFPGLAKRHSLGFLVTEARAPTGRSPGSLAWAGVANCYYWIDPAIGIGGVYMSQILPFMDYLSLPLFYAFETAVYDALG
jgi:CubicO group peptidase (beta-lactamase class C family)